MWHSSPSQTHLCPLHHEKQCTTVCNLAGAKEAHAGGGRARETLSAGTPQAPCPAVRPHVCAFSLAQAGAATASTPASTPRQRQAANRWPLPQLCPGRAAGRPLLQPAGQAAAACSRDAGRRRGTGRSPDSGRVSGPLPRPAGTASPSTAPAGGRCGCVCSAPPCDCGMTELSRPGDGRALPFRGPPGEPTIRSGSSSQPTRPFRARGRAGSSAPLPAAASPCRIARAPPPQTGPIT